MTISLYDYREKKKKNCRTEGYEEGRGALFKNEKRKRKNQRENV